MKPVRLLVLGLTILAACATFESEPLVPAESVAELETRTLDDPELRSFIGSNSRQELPEWPLAIWNLDNLTLAAFYFHPDLAVARSEWAVATAAEITAGERPNPTLGLTPAYNTTSSIVSPWIVTASIDVPLETRGKRGFRVDQAMQLSEAARLNVASVAWAVRSRVRSSLIDLYSALHTEELLREQQTLYAENVRLLELQFQAGAISAFELSQARLLANSARLATLDAERQSTVTRAQLASAIGVPVRALQDLELSFESLHELPNDLVAEESRRRALTTRADVLRALAEYAASQSALQLEIAKQFPDINLGPGYEYDQGFDKWSLGLSMTLPVFNRNQGAIAEALASRAAAAARFNAVQAGVLAEIEIASADYRAALRKQKDTDLMFVDLKYEETSTQAMFDAGEISRSELAGLQLQLNAIELARLQALVKAQQAAGQLEQALQFPLDIPASSWQNSPQDAVSENAENHP